MRPLTEIRRTNLAALVSEAGGPAPFAAKIKKDVNQVKQWLLTEDRGGHRNLGRANARHIETVCGKPVGWLDHEQEQGKVPVLATSQSVRIDPDILRAALGFMERQAAMYGARFEPMRDAELLADAYEVEARERAGLTPGNLLDFGEAVRRRMAEKGTKNDQGETGKKGG